MLRINKSTDFGSTWFGNSLLDPLLEHKSQWKERKWGKKYVTYYVCAYINTHIYYTSHLNHIFCLCHSHHSIDGDLLTLNLIVMMIICTDNLSHQSDEFVF